MNLEEIFIGLFFMANILFCAAYVVRDMAYLRMITIIAASSTIPYFLLQSTPMWSAIFWQAMFVAINGYNLTVLLLRRRPVKLEPREDHLRLLVFNLMKPRELKELIGLGEWKTMAPGDRIVEAGDFVDGLYLIERGNADVTVDGGAVARLGEGDFVGEMSFVTGSAASADVVASSEVDYLFWKRSDLEPYYLKHPQMQDMMQGALGRNMAQKLRQQGGQDRLPA